MPYPANEDQIEEERVEAQVGVREAYLPEYLEALGNQTLAESVCQYLHFWPTFSFRTLWLSLARIDGLWPNPFTGLNLSDANLAKQQFIYLVDGSEYGQVSCRPIFLPSSGLLTQRRRSPVLYIGKPNRPVDSKNSLLRLLGCE